jgi:glycosyltransferase involved in cell wall biosynthesis
MCSAPRRARCDNLRLRILHVIHDFLPRHQAGSEIYALDLCRELSSRHSVTILCAEYDPTRQHGDVVWRVVHGLTVVEIINNWICHTFEDTYRASLIGDRVRRVLHAIQPHVVHVHNLMNLTFDLPALAQADGIPVVATLHDYSLVCASGGQRIHRAEAHVCEVIDVNRCARCFRESPYFGQLAFGKVASVTHGRGWLSRAVVMAARRLPAMASRAMRTVRNTRVASVTPAEIERRTAAARAAFAHIDLAVAPSPSLAREFERLGFDAAKIRTSDYGFVPLTRSGHRAARRPLRFGFVGTLVWHKGVHVLLEALRGLPVEGYTLDVFGDTGVFPDYVGSLRKQAAGLPVTFAGSFARNETAAVYSAIDVLVVPSIWMENSPLVIHEAFMAGIPVVGARMGGIADLVEDGISGLLYDARSPADLRAILQRLIEHPEEVSALSARAPSVKPVAADASEWEKAYTEVCVGRVAGARA